MEANPHWEEESMSTKYLTAVLSAALLAGGASYADDKRGSGTHDDQTKSQTRTGTATDRAGTTDADQDTWIGRVKEYNPGRSLKLDIKNAIDKSFDLQDRDMQVQVHPDVKVGSMVKVTQTEQDGKKLLDVQPHEAQANGSRTDQGTRDRGTRDQGTRDQGTRDQGTRKDRRY